MTTKNLKNNTELLDFIKQYEKLTNKCDFDLLIPFIDENAIYWFSNGTYYGIKEIRKVVEETWKNIKNEIYTISNIQWLIATKNEGVYI